MRSSPGARARRPAAPGQSVGVVVAAGLDEARNSALRSGVASISNGARRTAIGRLLVVEGEAARVGARGRARARRRRSRAARAPAATARPGPPAPASRASRAARRTPRRACPRGRARGGGSSSRASSSVVARDGVDAGVELARRGARAARRATAARRASGRRARAGPSRRSRRGRRSSAAAPRRRSRRRRARCGPRRIQNSANQARWPSSQRDQVDAGAAAARARRRRRGRSCAPASSRAHRAARRRARRRRGGARQRPSMRRIIDDACHHAIRWTAPTCRAAARPHRLAGARRGQQRQLAHRGALAALPRAGRATVERRRRRSPTRRDGDADLLIALHARRSAASIARWRERRAGRAARPRADRHRPLSRSRRRRGRPAFARVCQPHRRAAGGGSGAPRRARAAPRRS